MFNKRGQELGRNTVVGLILALAILIMLVGLFYVVFVEREDVFTRKICQISVYFSDQTLGIFNKLGIGGIFCKTYYKEFKNVKKDKFMEDIAENMRWCWWMWGEGKLDPVGKNLVKWSDYQCFNCYVIEPLGDVPKITAGELEKYLQKENVGDSDTTYWNYFRGFSRNWIIFNFPGVQDLKGPLFKEGKFYAITFVENTQPSVLGKMITFGAAGALACSFTGPGALVCGLGSAVIAGGVTAFEKLVKDYFDYNVDAIMLSEYDERNNVCSGEIG